MTKIFTIRYILFHDDDTYPNIVFCYFIFVYLKKNKNKDANNKQQDKYSIKDISRKRQTAFNGKFFRVLSDQYMLPRQHLLARVATCFH